MEGKECKSILVPSVQELAKDCVEQVPERYIRPFNDHDRPCIKADDNHDHDHDHDLHVPIISLEALISGDPQELERLHSACQDWGFFQLVEHGVSPSLVEKFKRETQEFFKLPREEKRKYWQLPRDVEGFGQAFVISEKQKLDWADIFYLTTLPKTKQKPRLLPSFPLPYRDTLNNYCVELEKLARAILDCMAKALKIDSEKMRSAFGEGRQSCRMNYYPPCPQPEKVIGLTPHSDAVALTILLQLNEMEGLQIMNHGTWVPVKPLPHAFIVNIGDILEIITNGIYRSILHRAVVNKIKARLSVAAFYNPSHDLEIGPIPDLVTPQTPARFRRIQMVDYLKGLFSRELDGKAYLDAMRINQNNHFINPNNE